MPFLLFSLSVVSLIHKSSVTEHKREGKNFLPCNCKEKPKSELLIHQTEVSYRSPERGET